MGTNHTEDEIDDATLALSGITLQPNDIFLQIGDSTVELYNKHIGRRDNMDRFRLSDTLTVFVPETPSPESPLVTPTSSEQLHTRLTNLPQDLYDKIWYYVFAFDFAPINGHHVTRIQKPYTHYPMQLQICHAMREDFASQYYGGSAEWVFSTPPSPEYFLYETLPTDAIVSWLGSLCRENRAALAARLGKRRLKDRDVWTRQQLPYAGIQMWCREPRFRRTGKTMESPGEFYADWPVRFGLAHRWDLPFPLSTKALHSDQ